MKFRINKQVEKDLKKKNNQRLLIQLKNFLLDIKGASTVNDLAGIKKLRGEKDYYRYRIGEYRVGFKVVDNEVLILKVAHRKEIYRNFP